MEKKTVRAFYDEGEVRFLDPVHMEGCWNLEVTFVEQVDDEGVVFESNPHRPEVRHTADRLEELHRQIEGGRPNIGPI